MRRRRAGLWLALVGLAVSCADEQTAAPRRAPVSPRAAWLLEPAQIGVGQVTTLELAVVTPAGCALAPYTPPPPPPGLALLSSETLPVVREDARWIQRTQLRLRAMAIGAHTWPAGTIGCEAQDGTQTLLDLPEHPIEVVSILPEYPDRVAPFGARAPASRESRTSPVWAPALLGAATAFAAVALGVLARRRRQASAGGPSAPAAAGGPPAWERARAEIDAARSRAGCDPFVAAHGLSLALRHFVDRRFGSATAGRTGEELREAAPPFSARSRWPALLAILAGLDEFRFRPAAEPDTRAALAARLAGLIEAAARFVEDAVPPEARP